MNKNLTVMLGSVVLVVMCCSGCRQMGAGISGSSRPITAKDSYSVVKEEVSGSSWAFGFQGFQFWPTSAYDAVQNAKGKCNADALINMAGNNIMYYIPPLFPYYFSLHRMKVSGDAIKFQRGGGQ